jgi:hypothetical protein
LSGLPPAKASTSADYWKPPPHVQETHTVTGSTRNFIFDTQTTAAEAERRRKAAQKAAAEQAQRELAKKLKLLKANKGEAARQ